MRTGTLDAHGSLEIRLASWKAVCGRSSETGEVGLHFCVIAGNF